MRFISTLKNNNSQVTKKRTYKTSWNEANTLGLAVPRWSNKMKQRKQKIKWSATWNASSRERVSDEERQASERKGEGGATDYCGGHETPVAIHCLETSGPPRPWRRRDHLRHHLQDPVVRPHFLYSMGGEKRRGGGFGMRLLLGRWRRLSTNSN